MIGAQLKFSIFKVLLATFIIMDRTFWVLSKVLVMLTLAVEMYVIVIATTFDESQNDVWGSSLFSLAFAVCLKPWGSAKIIIIVQKCFQQNAYLLLIRERRHGTIFLSQSYLKVKKKQSQYCTGDTSINFAKEIKDSLSWHCQSSTREKIVSSLWQKGTSSRTTGEKAWHCAQQQYVMSWHCLPE